MLEASLEAKSETGWTPELRRTAQELIPLFYEDVRRLARQQRRRLGGQATMQTTALIHEAYLRLRNSKAFNDRPHFLRAAALAMRSALVNYARDRVTAKRGAGATAVPLEDAEHVSAQPEPVLIEVNEALDRLAILNPRLAQIVECRFFAGYDDAETALALGITDRTVRRDWVKARAWLRRELGTAEPT